MKDLLLLGLLDTIWKVVRINEVKAAFLSCKGSRLINVAVTECLLRGATGSVRVVAWSSSCASAVLAVESHGSVAHLLISDGG